MEKVRNIEEAGAGMAIIVDNHVENVTNIIMSDDGSGAGLRIPSVLISKSDGDKIIDFIKTASDDEKESLFLVSEFNIKRPDNRVEYDIWFSAPNDQALDFFQDFRQIDKRFGDKVLMTPRYVFWECKNCDNAFKNTHCFKDGSYCATSKTKLTGQQVILEDLRQMCIYD